MDDDDDLMLIESTRYRLESRLLCKDIMLAESREIGLAIAESIQSHLRALSAGEVEAEVERMRRCVADVHEARQSALTKNVHAAVHWEELSIKLNARLRDVRREEREALESTRALMASANDHIVELKKCLSDLERDCVLMQTRLGKHMPVQLSREKPNPTPLLLWPKRGYAKKRSPVFFVGFQRRFFLLDREENSKAVLSYFASESDEKVGLVLGKIYLEPSQELIVRKDRWVSINIKQRKFEIDCGDDVEAEAWCRALRQCAANSGTTFL